MFIWIRIAGVLVVVVWRETDADSLGANRGSDCFDNFKREPAAVFNRTTVCVGAFVDVVVEELFEEVSVSTAS